MFYRVGVMNWTVPIKKKVKRWVFKFEQFKSIIDGPRFYPTLKIEVTD